jgi:hypothetical protein
MQLWDFFHFFGFASKLNWSYYQQLQVFELLFDALYSQ